MCDALQKQYFRTHGDDRNNAWLKMNPFCIVNTWFKHKGRRTMRLFSKKIKVGDYVYNKTNKKYHGRVISITPTGYYTVKMKNDKTVTEHSTLWRKITKQQHEFLIDNELNKTSRGDVIALGDNVRDKLTQNEGTVYADTNRFFYVYDDHGKSHKVLKENAELISANSGGRRKTRRSAPSKRRFRTNGRIQHLRNPFI